MDRLVNYMESGISDNESTLLHPAAEYRRETVMLEFQLPVNCNMSNQVINHVYGTLSPNSAMSKTTTLSLTCNMTVDGTLEIVNGASTGLTPVDIGCYGSADIGISVDGAKFMSRESFVTTANVPRTFTMQTNLHTGKTPGSFSGGAVIAVRYPGISSPRNTATGVRGNLLSGLWQPTGPPQRS